MENRWPELSALARKTKRQIVSKFVETKQSGRDLVVGGTVVVDPPQFGGQFELDSRSHLFYRLYTTGEYEPEVVSDIRSHEAKGDALDVGANVGFFSVLFANLGFDQVAAFEPSPEAFPFLQSNIARNGLARKVTPHQLACADISNELEFEFVEGLPEYSSFSVQHDSTEGKARLRTTVQSTTVDEFVETHHLRPSLIKVDVEGAELRVLKGAKETLKTYRPRIYVETTEGTLRSNGASLSELLGYLNGFGYQITQLTKSDAVANHVG